MNGQCVFCNIAAGEIPVGRVYENGRFIAFLDANPCAEGHTVIIPKGHYETVEGMPHEDAADFLDAVQGVVRALTARVHPDGFTMGVNHGEAAGQAVKHFHFHVIPRFRGDGGGSLHTVVPRR